MSDQSKPNIRYTRRVVSRAEWLEGAPTPARKGEGFHARSRSPQRRTPKALPWVAVEKKYVFDEPSSKVTLADLFGKADQLFIKHFMLPPGQAQPLHRQFVRSRWTTSRVSSSTSSTHGGVPCVASLSRSDRGDRSGEAPHGVALSAFVSSFSSDFELRLPRLALRPRSSWRSAPSTASRHGDPGPPRTNRGNSVFFKDERLDRSSTPIRHSRGGARSSAGTYAFLARMPKGRDENAVRRTRSETGCAVRERGTAKGSPRAD